MISFRRHLKRRNCSPHTIRSYLNNLKQFIIWVDKPIEQVTHRVVGDYIDYLLRKNLAPKTINCHLVSIRRFYEFLCIEEELDINNPVKKGRHLRLAKPLPKHLKDDEIIKFLAVITGKRDRAIFMLMLRSGMRVGEVANLTLDAVDWRRKKITVISGKGGKDRIVYISNDSFAALVTYVQSRRTSRMKKVFLVERGVHKGRPISVRGIQKRMEFYVKECGIQASCHHLRHTMATQLLNADADLVTIQDLLSHERIKTTQRYCKVSNLKVERDYFKSMDRVLKRMEMI